MSNTNQRNHRASGQLPDVTAFSKKAGEVLMRDFAIERVTSRESLLEEWEPLLVEIFPDETDRESPQELLERFDNGENFFLMRDANGKAVGMELSQVMLGEGAQSTAMYIPWTGVVEEHRNNGIGSQMNRTISGHMREAYGVTHTIIDIEDPERLYESGYAEDELDEAIGFAERRINFWRREGFLIVDDEDTPTGQKFEYCRPASIDEQEVQAYDHLCVRFDDPDLEDDVLSPDGVGIDKDFIRECYLDITKMQYGNMSEDELRAEYPAVDEYLEGIDALPSAYLPFRNSAITPKQTSNADISMRMRKETLGQQKLSGEDIRL